MTIIVPALNEAERIRDAVATIVGAADAWFQDYEILIFDDGSTDGTGEIAEELARKFPRVCAHHHSHSRCLGGVLRHGWELASKEYVMWVDSQGVTTRQALDEILAKVGQADIVIPYATNQSERPLFRRFVARLFVAAMNWICGLDLHQYTHLVVYPVRIARQLNIATDSYAFHAEALIRALATGATWVEVGVEDRFNIPGRKSKALRVPNVFGVLRFMVSTLLEFTFGRPGPKERRRR